MDKSRKQNNIRVIVPETKVNIIDSLKSYWDYRELLYTITMREIKLRYKQTILGVVWAIIQPASLTILFSVIFGKFAKIPTGGIPYPIFAYSALLPWTFFSTAISFSIPSLIRDRSLLMKVYFPREICPFSSVLAAGLDFAISSIVFILMILFYKIHITLNIFWVIPLFIVQLSFTVGISLLFSGINACYRDVRYAVPLFIQLWMFATPIFYPVTIIPERYRLLYMLNPMSGIIDGYRRVIIRGIQPELRYILLSAIVSFSILILSHRIFKHLEKKFIDII